MIPYSLDYNTIEEIIKPHHLSIRHTAEPLHLHWHGMSVKKFADKRALVTYLNDKLRGKIAA
jgi:hypothetical protein